MGKVGAKVFPHKGAQLGALATGLSLAAAFLLQTSPTKPPPFPPLPALPFEQPLPFPPLLLFILLLKQGGSMAMVPGPARQQGRTGVRCGITLPELQTQSELSKTSLRVPVTNKENSPLPAN